MSDLREGAGGAGPAVAALRRLPLLPPAAAALRGGHGPGAAAVHTLRQADEEQDLSRHARRHLPPPGQRAPQSERVRAAGGRREEEVTAVQLWKL